MITMQDLRALGYCTVGARRVCKSSGVDFRSFMKNGVTLEQVKSFNIPDKYKQEIVEAYSEREGLNERR